MKKFLLVFLLPLHVFALELDGGEIGNAFVPFESMLGGFKLEYPKTWKYFDLNNTVNFTDPGAPMDKASFFSVLTGNFPGIADIAGLRRHLEFFQPDEKWEYVEIGGLKGFQNKGEVRVVYLFRGKEDLVSLRARSSDGASSDAVLRHMFESLKVE
jgi:hypothetical protein